MWRPDTLKPLFCALFILCIPVISIGSPHTNTFYFTNELDDELISEYCVWAYDSTGLVSAKQIHDYPHALAFTPVKGDLLHRGYFKPKHPIWIKFRITNTEENRADAFLEIPFPNIDEVSFYAYQKSAGLAQEEHTGIAHPFDSRQIKDRNFVFKIEIPAHSTMDYLIRVERKYDELLLPIRLIKASHYSGHLIWDITGNSIFIGISFFFIIAAMAYGIVIRDKMSFTLTMMLAFILIFHIGDSGIGFQLLWPNLPWLQPKIRPLGSFISQSAFVYFTMLYFDTANRPKLQWANIAGKLIIGIYLFLTVHIIAMDAPSFEWLPNKNLFVNIFLLNLLFLLSFGTIICIQTGFFGNAKSALYTIAFLGPAFGCAVLAARNANLLAYGHFANNFLKYAHIVMFVSLALAITHRIREERRRAKRLQEEKIAWQKEREAHQLKVSEASKVAAERTRETIGNDLHDGLGALLVTTKHHLENLAEHFEDSPYQTAYKKITNLIDQGYKETRKISHEMVIHPIKEYGLQYLLQEYCSGFSESSLKVNFWHFGLENPIPHKTAESCYKIIKELVTNVLKHAHATEVIINVSLTDQILSITVEDDGIGFNTDTLTNKGVGLGSIQKRIDNLEGLLDIKSSANGTSIYIEFLVATDKSTPKIYETANN